MKGGARILQRLDALDRLLVKKGYPALSPWWRETLTRFYLSGRRQLVLRVGRRGGKSSSLCRVAVLEALYGEHDVPPGDIGYVVFVSVSRDEASARLRTISGILDALDVRYTRDGDTIVLNDKRVGFKVATCSISGVSGWTAILIVADEVAKWHSKETGANPAAEVLASLRPTLATQKNARIFLSSSPMTEDDEHAKAYTAGDNGRQIAAYAPTWIANPSVTEDETHEIEPDDRVWRREYLAVPQSAIIDGFLSDVVDACVDLDRTGPTNADDGFALVALDPAFRHDEFVAAAARASLTESRAPLVVVEAVEGWRAAKGQPPLNVQAAVRRCATLARTFHAQRIVGDQYHADSLTALFLPFNIAYEGIPWTAPSKVARFTALRALMNDQRVRLPNDPKTIAQLKAIGVRLLPSGVETIEARGADDRAYAVCLAATEAARHAPAARSRAPRMRTADAFDLSSYARSQGWTEMGTSVGFGIPGDYSFL